MKTSLVAFFWRSLTKCAVKFIFDGGTWSVAGKYTTEVKKGFKKCVLQAFGSEDALPRYTASAG